MGYKLPMENLNLPISGGPAFLDPRDFVRHAQSLDFLTIDLSDTASGHGVGRAAHGDGKTFPI